MAIVLRPYTSPVLLAARIARVPFEGYRTYEADDAEDISYPSYDEIARDDIGLSRMGFPLFSRLKINAVEYEDYDRKGERRTYTTQEMVFEDAIMSVRHVNNVVLTAVPGGVEVAQHTGRQATRVSVQTFLFNDPNGPDAQRWPSELIANMRDIARAPIAFPVDSLYLQPHGISEARIENVSFAENVGINVQPVTFELVEDVRIDLQPELN